MAACIPSTYSGGWSKEQGQENQYANGSDYVENTTICDVCETYSQPPAYVQCRKPHNKDLLFGIRLEVCRNLFASDSGGWSGYQGWHPVGICNKLIDSVLSMFPQLSKNGFSTGDIAYDPRHAACTYVSHRTHIDWNYHSRDILTPNDILLMLSTGISGISDKLHCLRNLFNFTQFGGGSHIFLMPTVAAASPIQPMVNPDLSSG
ncbi:hypothetical protein B0H13DRAFT_1902811 [Mycena leptocephala]|nr:hypothetical protein B0H13DRAFT_1902811 [Mycena leptocephala]